MATKTVHSFGNDEVTIKKIDTITGEVLKNGTELIEYAHVPEDKGQAVSSLLAEEKATQKAYAGAMAFILPALMSVDMVPYAGKGLIEEDGVQYRMLIDTQDKRDAVNGYRSAFRDAAKAATYPALLEKYKGDTLQAGKVWAKWLASGSFAVAASNARKFFYFTGQLPCAYNADGTPDPRRALSVPAMLKIMREIPEQGREKATFAGKLRALMQEWIEKGGRAEAPNDISALLGYLDMWRSEVLDAGIPERCEVWTPTQNGAAQMMVQTRPDALVDAIKAEWDALEEEKQVA